MEFQNIFEATRMQKRSQRAHEPEMEVSGLNWKMNKGVMVNLQGEQYWGLLELLFEGCSGFCSNLLHLYGVPAYLLYKLHTSSIFRDL